jgi:hypothetical protein
MYFYGHGLYTSFVDGANIPYFAMRRKGGQRLFSNRAGAIWNGIHRRRVELFHVRQRTELILATAYLPN